MAHLPGQFARGESKIITSDQASLGFGISEAHDPIWTYEGLRDLKAMINAEGLELEALENFAPAHRYDVLLDGPRRTEQMEHLKQILRDIGRVGIRTMGYNFSVAGVKLALHPDDPPLPSLRGAARLVYHPDHFQRVYDLQPSPMNAIEFCVGTVSEMAGADVYGAVDRYSRAGRIAYVHLRNVRGKVPCYHEAFVDDGDTDMLRVLKILHGNGFDGVIIPDHTPLLTCDAPWHAGIAYALGWIRAALTAVARG